MATPRRLDPSDDSVGGFNDLDNSVVADSIRGGSALSCPSVQRSSSTRTGTTLKRSSTGTANCQARDARLGERAVAWEVVRDKDNSVVAA
jgi:hypothetical protein